MGVSFQAVTTADQQRELADLASEIWHEYWPALIGPEQTDYMVELFQSPEAIERDMREHAYEYWFLRDDEGSVVGYTGGHVESETNRFFISKIYLRADARGHGYARRTVEFYDALCRQRGLRAMYLTVNKGNAIAIRAYNGTGFSTIDSVVNDIGGGFVMDDYIMERPVEQA